MALFTGKVRNSVKHWMFADVPYHLAYFDLDVIATAIRRGLDVPIREQVIRTEADPCREVGPENDHSR